MTGKSFIVSCFFPAQSKFVVHVAVLSIIPSPKIPFVRSGYDIWTPVIFHTHTRTGIPIPVSYSSHIRRGLFATVQPSHIETNSTRREEEMRADQRNEINTKK
jgi:hypothetical protein